MNVSANTKKTSLYINLLEVVKSPLQYFKNTVNKCFMFTRGFYNYLSLYLLVWYVNDTVSTQTHEKTWLGV